MMDYKKKYEKYKNKYLSLKGGHDLTSNSFLLIRVNKDIGIYIFENSYEISSDFELKSEYFNGTFNTIIIIPLELGYVHNVSNFGKLKFDEIINSDKFFHIKQLAVGGTNYIVSTKRTEFSQSETDEANKHNLGLCNSILKKFMNDNLIYQHKHENTEIETFKVNAMFFSKDNDKITHKFSLFNNDMIDLS